MIEAKEASWRFVYNLFNDPDLTLVVAQNPVPVGLRVEYPIWYGIEDLEDLGLRLFH